MKRAVWSAAIACGVLASAASAYDFRVRFQWRPASGGTFVNVPEIGGVPTLTLDSLDAIRIRLQLGVFDSPSGPAPAGGFVGVNQTVITTTAGGEFSLPPGTGRIGPFQNPGVNGTVSPDGLSIGTFHGAIDAAITIQAFPWPEGMPTPPPAIVYGRNEFASVYQFVDTPREPFKHDITVTSGNVFTTTGWRTIVEVPPEEGVDGQVIWGPIVPIITQPGSWMLRVVVPAPGCAALLGIAGVMAGRRRRS